MASTGYISTYLANELLDHSFDNSAYTPASTVYLALFTDNPTADDTGTEVAGGSYARKAMSFGSASGASISSDAVITFSDLPDTSSTPITHYGIYDASTAGNLLFYGALSASVSTESGDELELDSGAVDISFVTE